MQSALLSRSWHSLSVSLAACVTTGYGLQVLKSARVGKSLIDFLPI